MGIFKVLWVATYETLKTRSQLPVFNVRWSKTLPFGGCLLWKPTVLGLSYPRNRFIAPPIRRFILFEIVVAVVEILLAPPRVAVLTTLAAKYTIVRSARTPKAAAATPNPVRVSAASGRHNPNQDV
jgi:hypothetical protein